MPATAVYEHTAGGPTPGTWVQGVEFVHAVGRCAQQLGMLAFDARGPYGRCARTARTHRERLPLASDTAHPTLARFQLLCPPGETSAVTVTSVSARLFANLGQRSRLPVAQILTDAVARHHTIHGDGGLLLIGLATRYAARRLAHDVRYGY
jgi:hypothetical protein